MLKRMMDFAIVGANPIDAFASGIGLCFRRVHCRFANRIPLLNVQPFLLALLVRLVFTQPTHLLGDNGLGFVGVAVLIQQFHVFVRARVALLEKAFVIVFVPVLFGIFATTLMTLDRLGGAAHEFSHAGGGLLGALRVFLGSHSPFRRGNGQFVVRAFDNDASVGLAEPFQVKAVG